MCQQKWLKYWCHRRDTNQSEPCLNPSGQNLSIRRFNKGQLYDLSRLWGTALEAESGLVINVNKNTGAGYSPIISIHCVNVAISKTSITFKSVFFIRCRRSDSSIFVDKWNLTAATIARSFSQRPQVAIRQLRTWPRIHVQPRFQWGFRNGVTFLRVVYDFPWNISFVSLLSDELFVVVITVLNAMACSIWPCLMRLWYVYKT